MFYKKISVVVPSYNEEGNVEVLYKKLCIIFGDYGKKYRKEIIFVDDGSTDNTLKKVKEICTKDMDVKCVSLSKNFGHPAALKAGLDFCTGDGVITMDADLQHPPELIVKLIYWWERGYGVINTIRNDQKTAFAKKVTSKFFYSLINMLADLSLKEGSADFRLMDKSVVDQLKNLKDSGFFLRGLVDWSGFKTKYVKYMPNKRYSGKAKYSIKKMVKFAIDGITSFSVKPLMISVWLGLIFALFSFIYLIYALIVFIFKLGALNGWTSVIASVLFLGGIQLIIMGVIGTYIGQIYFHVKERPFYLVEYTNIK